MWKFACGSTRYATGTTFNTTSWMSWSALWTLGLESTKQTVWENKFVISSQVVISLSNSNDTYHDLGISSKVWKKEWTHSSFGHDAHKVWHSIKWSLGLFRPSYHPAWYISASPKWIVIGLRQCDHPMIDLLWFSHHRDGVAFSASSSTNNRWGSNTFS